MLSQNFESTLPFDDAVRARALSHARDGGAPENDFRDTDTDPSTLSPSLRTDLSRFEDAENGADLLG
ncbi:MAG: hypothetical protein ABL900_15260, partial [Burkholderiaceae bacterium]